MSPNSIKRVKEILGKPLASAVDGFVVTITPAMAVALLQHNANIRRLRETVITTYMTDMILGGWTLTGEPIIFDKLGLLKNGQHRLTACVRADVPFTTFVVVGVDSEVDLNMDRPSIRTLGDFLWKQGLSDPKNLAASIRLAYQLVEERRVEQSPRYSNEVLIRWFKAGHEGLVDDLSIARELEGRWPKGFTRNHGAAIRHAAGFVPGVEVDDVDDFLKSLAYDMETVDTRSAPHVLHRAFEQMVARSRSGRIQIPVRIAVTILALNAYLAGEDVTPATLRWHRGGRNPDPFPTISPGVLAEAIEELEG